jgi:uncharacterized protein (DUF736 family)
VPRNPDELGALWSKSGKKGEYMTGTINGVNVVCFKNDRKEGNQPDWRVMKSKPKEERAAAPRSAETEPEFAPDPEW